MSRRLRNLRNRRLRPLAAVPVLLVLAGCGADAIPAADVAAAAESALEEEVGFRPEIACPDDLEAEVGAQTRCTLTAGEDPTEYGVTVTVASLDGEEPGYTVEVDDAPLE